MSDEDRPDDDGADAGDAPRFSEKELLGLAQEAFSDWLRCVDDILHDAELSFEEFTGHGLRRELESAGQSLARAEGAVRCARAVLAEVVGDEPGQGGKVGDG